MICSTHGEQMRAVRDEHRADPVEQAQAALRTRSRGVLLPPRQALRHAREERHGELRGQPPHGRLHDALVAAVAQHGVEQLRVAGVQRLHERTCERARRLGHLVRLQPPALERPLELVVRVARGQPHALPEGQLRELGVEVAVGDCSVWDGVCAGRGAGLDGELRALLVPFIGMLDNISWMRGMTCKRTIALSCMFARPTSDCFTSTSTNSPSSFV